MVKIIDIEGVGASHAAKLKAAGVATVEKLLDAGSSPSGRKALAEKSGINDDLILRWVNHADLFRIKGVGSEYSDLLEAAGVDTVVELSHRNAANLHEAIVAANKQKKRVRQVPSEKMVTAWVAQAKNLPRKVNY